MSEHEQLLQALKTIQAQNVGIKNALDKISPVGTMTRKEVAEHCKITLPTIHNAMRRGQLKYFKIGSATRFDREAVEKWMKEK